MKLAKTLQLLCIAASVMLIANNAAAQKLYKWVDANGNISYQDQPPPKDAKVLGEIDVSKSASRSNSSSAGKTEAIKVYTVDDCPNCARSVQHLIKLGIPHVELPLNSDREAQSMILEKTSSVVAPSILIGDDILQAPSNDALTAAVKKAGYKVGE